MRRLLCLYLNRPLHELSGLMHPHLTRCLNKRHQNSTETTHLAFGATLLSARSGSSVRCSASTEELLDFWGSISTKHLATSRSRSGRLERQWQKGDSPCVKGCIRLSFS